MELPEADRDLGHSEAQMRELLGDDFPHFQDYMYLKTTGFEAAGLIFYDADVRMYLAIRERRSS